MATGDGGGPINLRKRPPARAAEAPPGPAWLVVPARVIALIVVLPLRLVHDLLLLIGRGCRRAWNGLLSGLAAALDLLVVRPLRWLCAGVVLGLLRWFGRGTGRLAGWIHRVLLAPLGGLLGMIGRGLGRLLEFVLLRPLRLLGSGLAWVLTVLVAVPAALLWRYVLRPPLAGLAWLAGRIWGGVVWLLAGIAGGIARLWRGFATVNTWLWSHVAGAVAWTLRHIAAGLARTVRVLVGAPLGILWRYVLSPVLAGFAGAWRLAARLLRWLWRTLVVVPFRVLVAAPARWTRTHVLRPAGQGIREVWRVSVREPVRSVRRGIGDAGRDVRRLFRGH